MRKRMSARSAAMIAAVVGSALSANALGQVTFYFETFDSAVPTNQSGDPAVLNACAPPVPAFTHIPPLGWIRANCDTKTYACREQIECGVQTNCGTCATTEGVFEWEGWSFTSKNFWGIRTDNQRRTEFTLGTGIVAVADGDEWDDRGSPVQNCGTMNTFMSTPPISLAGLADGTLTLKFDSSWRPEGFDDLIDNNQTAIINAYYTVGGVEQPAVKVMHWDSDDLNLEPGNYFKPDATNEMVILVNGASGDDRFPGLQVPAGATSVRFEFAYLRAANDWWWALDNISVDGVVGGVQTNLFAEDFESVTLLPPVHEVPAVTCVNSYCGQNVYTHTGPNGVGVSVASPDTGGVPDWRGWSFVERAYWTCVSGGNGAGFVNASGRIAVADGDEFDDLPSSGGGLDTTLTTPAIDISGRSGNVVVLSFDSSWRYESPQTATVVAEYNTGQVVEVIRWESVPGPFFKDDAVNELVARALIVPVGATSVTLKFRYTGGNNWWWAIDNIRVFEGQATVTVTSITPAQNVMNVAPTIDYPACFTPWTLSPPNGWASIWDPCGACPSECGRPEWRGWAFAFKDWWWQRVDNQRRSEFTLGQGIVAIADPDEWDDFPNGQSKFNAFMTTPAITLPGTISSASLEFASSWRDEGFDDQSSCDPAPPSVNVVSITTGSNPIVTTSAPHGFQTGNYVTLAGSNSVPSMNGQLRVIVTGPDTFAIDAPVTITSAGTAGTLTRRPTNNQTAVIKATYTVGGVPQAPVEVFRWDSDGGRAAGPTQIFIPPSPFFHDDNPNEQVTIPLSALQVPAGAQDVKFEFALVNGRNDWWWAVDNIVFRVNGLELLGENFENVPNLAAPPTELPPINQCFYFSTVAQQAFNLSVDNSGLVNCIPGDDFYGWNAWLVDAWSRDVGGNRRQHGAFTAFVSDFDARGCDGATILVTPNYSINALNPGSVELSFRSGWDAAPGHSSQVQVSFNNGTTWTTVLDWNPSNKSTAVDEVVTVAIPTSDTDNTLRIRFIDRDAGWWAISNIVVTGIVGVPGCDPDFNQDGNVDQDDIACLSQVVAGDPSCSVQDPDFNRDGNVDQDDIDALSQVVAGASCP